MVARYVCFENPEPRRWIKSEAGPRCRGHCEPVADAILAGLEGAGEVTLLHFPGVAPMMAAVRLPELDIGVSLTHPIWTIEDALAQLPGVRARLARGIEEEARGWLT